MIKVLIADDEVRVCRLIQNLIDWKSLDMTVVGIANNGMEALDIIRAASPNLVITDIRMPGCDGLDLISRAKAMDPNLEFVIISGYRHFEYAQSAIKYGVSDYLLKPIKKDELMATLEKMKKKYLLKTEQVSKEERMKMRLFNDTLRLRSNFFTDSILGNLEIVSDIEWINSHYHYSFAPGMYVGFIIKIDSEDNGLGKEEMQILSQKIVDIMKKVKDLCFDSELYANDSRIYGIANYDVAVALDIDKTFRAAMEMLIAQKAAFSDIQFTICIGSEHRTLEMLKRSVNDAVVAMGERLITFGGRVIRFEQEMLKNECDDKELADLNRAMTSAVEVFDSEKLRRCIEEFCASISSRNMGGKQIFLAVIEAYNRYLILLQNLQLLTDPVGTDLQDFRKGADLCARKERLFTYFANRAVSVLDNLAENRENEESRPIRTAKDYIMTHYMEPITLEQVSSLVGFSSSYFSTFFKKKCGINFLEYVSEIRINKAKDLLRETNMSVADICEKVGYVDIKHFSSTFKKITGIKPTEFRKLYS